MSPSAQLLFSHAPLKSEAVKFPFECLWDVSFFFKGWDFLLYPSFLFLFFHAVAFSIRPKNVLLHVSGLVSISPAGLKHSPLAICLSAPGLLNQQKPPFFYWSHIVFYFIFLLSNIISSCPTPPTPFFSLTVSSWWSG